MYKIISFLILLILGTSACSKSACYAYDNEDDYCTIEVTRKNEVIYRASAQMYLNAIPRNEFIYIYSKDGATGEFVSFKYLSQIQVIRSGTGERRFGIGGMIMDEYPPLLYSREPGDKIKLVVTTETKNYLETNPLLNQNGITWLPPEMHRVKRIDYNRFFSGPTKLNLINPR